MNLTALALVVAAACLHALWNLAAKRVAGNLGVLWLGLCLAGVALAPVALYDASQSFDPAGLAYLAATGLIHAGYFGLLAAGYRRGELSVVYPLARGQVHAHDPGSAGGARASAPGVRRQARPGASVHPQPDGQRRRGAGLQ
jgi:hypothetical protein